jgi:hypothetical protein
MQVGGLAGSRDVVREKFPGGSKTPVFPKIDSRLVTSVAASNHEIGNGWQKTTGCRKYSELTRTAIRAVHDCFLIVPKGFNRTSIRGSRLVSVSSLGSEVTPTTLSKIL